LFVYIHTTETCADCYGCAVDRAQFGLKELDSTLDDAVSLRGEVYKLAGFVKECLDRFKKIKHVDWNHWHTSNDDDDDGRFLACEDCGKVRV
jgi:hypothetical protein